MVANVSAMPGNPLTDPNWAADAADTVERVVGKVRDKAITPVVKAARMVVFGLLAAFLGLMTLFLVLIGFTRGIQVLLDFAVDWDRAVYLSYFILGVIFVVAGMLAMRKRAPDAA